MINKRDIRRVKNVILGEIIAEIREEEKKRCSFPHWGNWGNWRNWINWWN